MSTLSRRSLTKGAAWSVPVVAVSAAAPAVAASQATCGLTFVRTDAMSTPEVFSEVSAIDVPAGTSPCSLSHVGLHLSVPDCEGGCANPQIQPVQISTSDESVLGITNPTECNPPGFTQDSWTVQTDGGVGLGEEGAYYSRYLFNKGDAGSPENGLVRIMGPGTATLTATATFTTMDPCTGQMKEFSYTTTLTVTVGEGGDSYYSDCTDHAC